jgi:hypothetical protein
VEHEMSDKKTELRRQEIKEEILSWDCWSAPSEYEPNSIKKLFEIIDKIPDSPFSKDIKSERDGANKKLYQEMVNWYADGFLDLLLDTDIDIDENGIQISTLNMDSGIKEEKRWEEIISYLDGPNDWDNLDGQSFILWQLEKIRSMKIGFEKAQKMLDVAESKWITALAQRKEQDYDPGD